MRISISEMLSHKADMVVEAQHMCLKAEAEEKPQSTHGQEKIRDYVHKLVGLLRQHNARIAF